MVGEMERRKCRRLPIRTDILCKKIGAVNDHNFICNSVNISTEGLLAESSSHTEISAGDIFNIEMDIPPENISDIIAGKFWTYGRVIRVAEIQPRPGKKHIAFQFCTRPHFEI
jgi:hypothetical protein